MEVRIVVGCQLSVVRQVSPEGRLTDNRQPTTDNVTLVERRLAGRRPGALPRGGGETPPGQPAGTPALHLIELRRVETVDIIDLLRTSPDEGLSFLLEADCPIYGYASIVRNDTGDAYTIMGDGTDEYMERRRPAGWLGAVPAPAPRGGGETPPGQPARTLRLRSVQAPALHLV
jgi:hypothetical protein